MRSLNAGPLYLAGKNVDLSKWGTGKYLLLILVGPPSVYVVSPLESVQAGEVARSCAGVLTGGDVEAPNQLPLKQHRRGVNEQEGSTNRPNKMAA